MSNSAVIGWSLLSNEIPWARLRAVVPGVEPLDIPIKESTIIMKFILAAAVLTIAAIPIALGQTKDNSLGTWKLNMEKSKFSPSAPVKSLTATREASDDGVKVTTTGERPDGTPINGSYTAKYDGKEYPVTGAPYDSIAIKQIDANTFTTVQKNSGTKYSTTTRAVVSKDGKIMTVTVRGTGTDGSRVRNTMVYEKQ
jgi:hypothetical protein